MSVFLLLLISSLLVQNTPLFGAMLSFLFVLSSCNLIRKIKIKFFLLVPFLFYISFIVYRLYVVDFDPRYIFINSQNWISFYGFLLFAPYAYKCFLSYEKLNLGTSLSISLLSIYSRSRSGIIGSILILLATFFFNRKFIWGFMLFIVLIPVSFILIYFSDFDQYTQRFSSLYNFLLNLNGRSVLAAGYFSSLQWYNYLLGIDLSNVTNSLYETTNLHNSYLNASSGIGVLGLVLLMAIFIESFIYFLKNNFGIALIWLAVLLRIATDSGALFNYFDAAVFFPLFLRLHKRSDVGKSLN